MTFEEFSADDPSQIVIGLFNGELQAAYMFHQTAPTTYQAHFTSDRQANREMVLAGARLLVGWFIKNGLMLEAFVHRRNRPLCQFAESVGLTQSSAEPSGFMRYITQLPVS